MLMKKHDIGLDCRMIRNTGIGTYVRGLLGPWTKTGGTALDLALFGSPGNIAAAELKWPAYSFNSQIYSIGEQLEYPHHLARCRLWHAPHYNVPLVKGRTKLVVTIHDLIHWIFRKDYYTPVQAFYAGLMLKRAVHSADRILTVSNKTRDDLIGHFKADPKKISVVYEGVDEKFCQVLQREKIKAVLSKYKIPDPYFFYVGMIKPHKQVEKLVRVFRKLRAEGHLKAGLVLVGKTDKRYPKGYEELQALEKEPGLIHLNFVEDEELVMLYNGALALVHPSRYEGFGLTLLEAMACGTPVIACRVASIPEVVGDAAYLVDCDEDEIGAAMLRIESDSALRETLKTKGCVRLRNFSWDEAARETCRIYEEVLSAS